MSALRWAVMTAALTVLAGCATYSSIKDRAPVYSAHSTKAPSAIAECVLPAWMATNASAHVVADGDARIVVVPTGGFAGDQVLMTLTVAPSATGSDVAMRTLPAVAKFGKQWGQAQVCL